MKEKKPNNRIKILALFGKSGAGKDTIQKWLVNTQNMNGIVSCTTRPKRDNEIDGVDYHFMENYEFDSMVFNGKLLEIVSFNGWFYGTPLFSLEKNKINVGVFDIQRIKRLLEDERIEVLPVYIDCKDKIRLLRCLKRESNVNCYEVCRRYLADEEDFKSISFNYEYYNNSYYNNDFYDFLHISQQLNNFIKDINN